MNSEEWKNRISRRSDFTEGLVHLTKNSGSEDSLDVLMRILTQKRLKGSTTATGYICGDTPAVCFQDAPLHSLAENISVSYTHLILGAHGDSELAVWSGANVSGVDLDHFCELRGHFNHEEAMRKIYEDVRDSAYEIIERKGATYYGIAMAVARIAESIVKDEQAVLPVSTVLDGEYGLRGLALSIPSVLGKNGVETVLEIPLSRKENQELHASAEQLKTMIDQLEA